MTVIPDEVRVAVGIPTFGRPRYVVDAVESVLAQTLDAWTLVIAEDGEGDRAVAQAIAPYLDDPRIEHRIIGRRIGAAANMTALITSACASYVAILHDDDRWAPGFLERRVRFMDVHAECGFSFSGNTEIDEAGNEIGRSRLAFSEGVHPIEEVVARLLVHNVVGTPTVLVRKSAYEAIGPYFDERFAPIYDYEMWLRLALRFPVGYLHTYDASWRRHGSQSTYQDRGWGAAHVAFLEHADRLVSATLPDLRLPRRTYARQLSARLVQMSLDALETGDRREAVACLRRAVRLHPPTLLDPRAPVAAALLVGGGHGGRALRRLRAFVHRRGIRLHLRRW